VQVSTIIEVNGENAVGKKVANNKKAKAPEEEVENLLQRAYDGDNEALIKLKETDMVKELGWENLLESAYETFDAF